PSSSLNSAARPHATRWWRCSSASADAALAIGDLVPERAPHFVGDGDRSELFRLVRVACNPDARLPALDGKRARVDEAMLHLEAGAAHGGDGALDAHPVAEARGRLENRIHVDHGNA